MELSDEDLQELYTWVDEIPLSRPKRNIARDFSDGVLAAEVVYHFFPKAVQLHNYSAANGFTQKMYNWNTLNVKVLAKLGFQLPKEEVEAVCRSAPLAAERVLHSLRLHLSNSNRAPSPHSRSSPAPGDLAGEYATYQAEARSPPAMVAQPVSPPPAKAAARTNPLPASLAAEERECQEQTIRELREMNEILETKTRKLEQLVRLKDAKIQTLLLKLETAEGA